MEAAIKSGHGLGIMNIKLAEVDEDLVRCFEAIEELSSEHLMLIAPEAYRRPEVKAFTKLKNIPLGQSDEDVSLITAQWKPWRSVAARILWHYYLS